MKKGYSCAQWEKRITNVGQRFEEGVKHLRQVLRRYTIKQSIGYVIVKNDNKRVKAHCKYVEGKCNLEVLGMVCTGNVFHHVI